jgi:hypothetical protein
VLYNTSSRAVYILRRAVASHLAATICSSKSVDFGLANVPLIRDRHKDSGGTLLDILEEVVTQ